MKISHLALNVSDMEKAFEFYCDKLGFERVCSIQDSDGSPWIEYLKVCPGQFLELFYGGMENQPKSNFAHLSLQVDDIYEIEAKMKELGVEIDVPAKKSRAANMICFVHDPDGNKIEFIQMMPESPQYKHC